MNPSFTNMMMKDFHHHMFSTTGYGLLVVRILSHYKQFGKQAKLEDIVLVSKPFITY